MLGDVNGDGYRNNYDIDAFELALEEYEDWEQEFGEPIGINLLSVGDCNNDGLFNNFDIDCFADLLTDPPGCGPCDSGESFGPGGGGGTGWDPEGPSWEYVQAQLAALREHFGME